ncbi:hypothetical protein [Ruania albidiflava]|nr:hypothetical protein [Ruania albidiflava]
MRQIAAVVGRMLDAVGLTASSPEQRPAEHLRHGEVTEDGAG